ncbi:ORCT-like protein, partial [Mya arenaria]
MRFDDVLDEIGGFGRYQKWVFFLTLGPNLLAGFIMLNPVFLLGIPEHSALLPNDSLREACSKWVYDLSVFTDTFASEHNLVCDKEIQVANAEMIFYGGMLVGSLASGIFADVYGPLELTSSSKRAWPGVISDFPYVLGLILMAVVAYIVREWFKLQLYTSLPGLLFLSYWWQVDTRISPLAANQGPKCMDDMDTDKTASFLQLFSSKKMCKTTVIVFVNWTIVAMTYFGLALNSDNLAGNLYLNFGLSAAVEIPAYFLVIYLVDRIGRRWLFTGSMLVGGLACASTVLAIEYEPGGGDAIVVALAMLGKLFITAAYSTAHIHSAELFPTVIRNAGMGGASLFASLGTMGEQLGGIWGEAFPLVVFGALAFLTGILSLALPETLGKNLPETVEDGERFG